MTAGIVPGAIELLDQKLCQVIEQSVSAGYPTDAAGMLLIEVVGLADTIEKQVQEISEICRKNKVRELRIAKTDAERDAIWMGRRGAFGAMARISPFFVVGDGTVPRDKLPEAFYKVSEIAAKYKVLIVAWHMLAMVTFIP